MKKEMNLKEFIEEMFNENPFHAMTTARDLVELEGIEKNLNMMWGVEWEIKVKPAEKKEGRFYGRGVIEAVARDFPQKSILIEYGRKMRVLRQ